MIITASLVVALASDTPAPVTVAVSEAPVSPETTIGHCAFCGQDIARNAQRVPVTVVRCPDCAQAAPRGTQILSTTKAHGVRKRLVRFPNGQEALISDGATPINSSRQKPEIQSMRPPHRIASLPRSQFGPSLGLSLVAADPDPVLGFTLGVDWAPFGRPVTGSWSRSKLPSRLSLHAGLLLGEWTGSGFNAPGYAAGVGFEMARGTIIRVGAAWIEQGGDRTTVPWVGVTF
jgi:hypothetical protein